jgi:hypothetical protein
MRKTLGNVYLMAILSAASFLVYAQTEQPNVNSYPVINWVSKTSSDKVTIDNGTGAELNIMITVKDNGSEDASVGINVENCGDTKFIKIGSSAICTTNSVKNPVVFSATGADTVSGTYQVKQQLPSR